MIGLAYDDDGNLTNDGTLEYEYDAENRMVSATPLYPVNGSQKLEAEYDYQGRRVQKTIYTYNAGIWELDTTKTFVYDGWNVIQEQTTIRSSTSTNWYVWGLDVSGSLQGAGGIGGLLLWKKDAGRFLYLYDANGNVGQLVNAATGAIAARYEYDPFGNTLVADGPEALNNVFRFSTKPYDAETGLYYYGYRYYSPKLGRWTTRDPIGEKGGRNVYAFVKNDGINRWDYLGFYTFEEAARKEYEQQNPYNPSNFDPNSGNDPMTEYESKFLFYYLNLSSQERFEIWYKWEKIQIATIGEWWKDLPRCPKTLCMIKGKPQNPDRTRWNNPGKPLWAELALHPGTAWSMRSEEDGAGHTNQCTYDHEGILLPTPPGSGTVDWLKAGTPGHMAHDVDPILLANELDGGKKMSLANPWGASILSTPGFNMIKYYEVRPLYAEP